jgi:glutaryl-CoA dehydrogenase
MQEPDSLDLFDVKSLLSEEEQLVQATVARFVDTEVRPIIKSCFDEQRFPKELVPELASLGLLGCTLKSHGCAGLGAVAYGLVVQELERGDASLQTFVAVQGVLAMGSIDAYGSEEQKARWLPPMRQGQAIGCFALSETHGGSNPADMKTRARRHGGDWILNGSKIWITNGSIADVAVVWAETDEGIRALLVEKDMPGFSTHEIENKFSLRASVTSQLFFDDVRVPDANLLPGAKGIGAALAGLTQGRHGISWAAIGAAQACFAELLEYAGTREVFGRPLTRTQSIQIRLAIMARRITGAQLIALQLGRLNEQGRMHPAQASLAKWNNVRMALEVARDCRDMLGGAGITTEFGTIRHMLNLESLSTYEGTESVHALVVGKALTGHSAF